jgi:hypothetical protein
MGTHSVRAVLDTSVLIATDVLIAATAHPHEARLYSRNPGDLVGLERLVDIVAV